MINFIYFIGDYMKKIFLFIICLFLSSCNIKSEEVVVSASSYIVIEQSTNKILEGYNYDEVRSVASISKIMTAIIAIENNDVNKIVVVPEEINTVYGSSIYLKVKEEISIIQLLYGLLLRSGNDAAITLAMATCKDVNSFVNLMNQKAETLGMKNTYFSNPHGLDEMDAGNLSTAYDMAILYSYCMDNELFAKIVGSKSSFAYSNKNKLINSYQYCTGGKTGYTKKAKRTLVSSASKDNINLIIVTLNCGNDFDTHKNKYEYYFNNFTSIKVLNKGNNIFDNETICLNKDYYFITDLNNLKLFYEILKQSRIINVTLYDQNNNVVDYMQVAY